MKTMKKTTAAIALAATAGLVAGPMVGMSQAWAAEGDITITLTEKDTDPKNTGVTYNAYEIFKADVSDGKASSIEWAAGVDATAQAEILKILGVTETGANSAQAAADAMSNLGIVAGSELAAKSEMMKIAEYVQEHVAPTAFEGDVATVSETGYYLILGTAKADTANSVATTPIFALVDGDGVDIISKISVPKVTKKVTDDVADAQPGDIANAEVEQALTFTLTSALPTNLASFDTYEFKFVDTYKTAGQFKAPTDVVITVGGKTIANDAEGVTVEATTNGLTVSFDDMIALGGKAEDAVIVTYKAALTKDGAAMSTEGSNDNEVYVEYTNDPISGGKGKTTTDDAKVYSYALKIEKQDSVTGAVIENAAATFTFTECDAEGNAIEGAKVFTATTENGLASVEGLDAGTYLVQETAAPTGYAKVEDFVLTITATEDMKSVTFSEDSGFAAIKEDAADTLVIKGAPNPMNLPVTGEFMGLIIMLTGTGVVLLSGIGFAVNRKRNASIED